jgi:AP endonuclease 1
MKTLGCAFTSISLIHLALNIAGPSRRSGCLGISAFHHIVNDRRTQDIPLILETPSFEQTEVWAKEVEVLHHLSGVSRYPEGKEMSEWVREIQEVVEKVSGKSSGQRKRGAITKVKGSRATMAEGD